MPTLKEIKGRIGSVRNTLKITSAMKLVSSAKLHKAQAATAAMRPYEVQLQHMLAVVSAAPGANTAPNAHEPAEIDLSGANTANYAQGPSAIIAVASNSSLCGGFNANAIAKVRSVRKDGDVVYSIGRKMAIAMRRDGFPSPEDFTQLSERPAYGPAAALVEKLAAEVAAGRFAQVILVYQHFVSTARQVPVTEVLLRASEIPGQAGNDAMVGNDASDRSAFMPDPIAHPGQEAPDIIIEPGRKELLDMLIPKTLKLKLYAALLDSAAAEHAARTVAMQTATDNGEDLLDELTLQYNKGRQQKITSEILDLAGGQAAE